MTKTLAELRTEIDAVDEQLVKLLQARAQLALEVRAAKGRENTDIYSPGRERQIIDRAISLGGNGPFPIEGYERVFRAILSATRSLVGDLSISYLNDPTSTALLVAKKHFGEHVVFESKSSSEEVIKSIELGETHFGILPLEDAFGALNFTTVDQILPSKLNIAGEIKDPKSDIRFIILGTQSLKPSGNDKTSLFCSTKDRSGALRDLLVPLADSGISMSKIASRAMKTAHWEHGFYVEFLGHQEDPVIHKALQTLKDNCAFFRVLGSYPYEVS
jgi:prephenate dehydratase/chorismate mutase